MPSRRRVRRAAAVIRWIVALIALSAIVGAATWWWLLPLRYVIDSYIAFAPARPAPFHDGSSLDEYAYTSLGDQHVALLKSAHVLEAALSRKDIASPGLAEDVRGGAKWLEDALEVEQAADGHVICIRLLAADSEQAEDLAKLLDAIVPQYVDAVVMRSRVADLAKQDALTELIKGLRKDLLAQHIEIEALEEVASQPNAEERAKLAMLRELATLNAELLAEFSAQERLESAWRTFAGKDEANDNGSSYPVRVVQNALVYEE